MGKPEETIDLKSREHFIKEVASTIKENHRKHDESYIFGISGKWGEGKTTFLNSLEKELANLDPRFEVFRVNPWKFGSDKISFLRTFLKQIFTTKQTLKVYFRDWLNNRDTFRSIDYDVSDNRIHPGIVVTVLVWLGLFALIYRLFLPEELRILLSSWKMITLLGIPIILALIGKIISVQRSSRAISTVDGFDYLLDLVLRNKMNKNLIIFLDDLDRVTPQIARDVLDNLRTFFDRKELTFVVTGDHSVLERHLGRELLPDSNSLPTQLEEGRRFLKKIFNVYWRLPLPIESELDAFLNIQFSKQSDALKKILDEENQKTLKKYLKDYFERNFRQILRFLETILFTFRVIQKKSSSIDEQEEKYFVELSNHPLLVIRILMIQELCAPLFERILGSHETLRTLEHAVELKNQTEIDGIISSIEMSPTQKTFINNFLFQEPRFYKDSSLVVSDLRPFLHLAADASFTDERGPSSADFIQILSTANPKAVRSTLLLSGDIKIREAAKTFLKQFDEATGSPKKKELLDTLVNGLIELDETYSVHKIFFEELKGLKLDFYREVESHIRVPSQLTIWRWLDKVDTDAQPWIEKFPFLNHQDFDHIKFDESKKAGSFATNVIMQWFNQYYNQDKMNALTKTGALLPNLDLRVVRGQIDIEKLSGDIFINQSNDLRTKITHVLLEYSNKGIHALRDKLFERLGSYNDQALWSWSVSQASNKDPWTRRELELAVLSSSNPIADDQSLIRLLRFCLQNFQTTKKELWQKIANSHLDRLINLLPQIIGDQSFLPIAPDSESGIKILNGVIEKIKFLSDESQKGQWLEYIKKGLWIWSNIEKIPLQKISSFARSNNEAFKSKYNEIKASWGTA